MKKAIILQYFGIGDCIFAQGIARKFLNEGYEVMWPVMPDFVQGLQRAYPAVNWLPYTLFSPGLFNIRQEGTIDGVTIVPIRWADTIIGIKSHLWMRAKYDMYSMDYKLWKNFADYKRDSVREQVLMERYGIKQGEPFILVNTMYRSDMQGSITPKVSNGMKVVRMKIVSGYSLFDYSLMIEKAAEIHVANSAILYLLELLNLSAKEVHIYARKEEGGNFPYVDYLMTKNYILHPLNAPPYENNKASEGYLHQQTFEINKRVCQ
jgi:hypothetical protein